MDGFIIVVARYGLSQGSGLLYGGWVVVGSCGVSFISASGALCLI